MQNQFKVQSIKALPTNQRRRTDCFCVVINTVFVVLLFIIACFTFNRDVLTRISHPYDSDGLICGIDHPKFPILYFATLGDATRRVCVQKCPGASDTKLNCMSTASVGCSKNANPKYRVDIYDTELATDKIGWICLPTDPAAREKLLVDSKMSEKYEFLTFYSAIWRSTWISALFGILSFMLVHFLPYQVVPWTILLGSIASIVFGLIILLFTDGYFLIKLLVFIFFTVLGLYSLYSLIRQQRREGVWFCARMIHAAIVIDEPPNNEQLLPFLSLATFKKLAAPFLLIFIFIAFFFVFLILIAFQLLAAWSCATMVKADAPEYPFYTVKGLGSNILMVLIVIEFIWGMSCLKESFNFIVSSYAAYRYCYNAKQQGGGGGQSQEEPTYWGIAKLLLLYHWGSVVGGSFLLSLFYFVDFAVDFFMGEQGTHQKADPNNKDYLDYDRQLANSGGCLSFLNLIRSQSFAYTCLTGIPYCNSARYCQFLSNQSSFYNYSQTTNRIFRLNQHILPIVLTVIIAILTTEGEGKSPYAMICVVLITFFIVTYFLAYHGDSAEGVLVTTFVDQALGNAYPAPNAPNLIKRAYRQDETDRIVSLWSMLVGQSRVPLD